MQRVTRVCKLGACYEKRYGMEQLASIPLKFFALLSTLDPYLDITLTARFRAFQYTARLKLPGLTRYDMKGRLAPLENSGGTCTNDYLECCTARRGQFTLLQRAVSRAASFSLPMHSHTSFSFSAVTSLPSASPIL